MSQIETSLDLPIISHKIEEREGWKAAWRIDALDFNYTDLTMVPSRLDIASSTRSRAHVPALCTLPIVGIPDALHPKLGNPAISELVHFGTLKGIPSLRGRVYYRV